MPATVVAYALWLAKNRSGGPYEIDEQDHRQADARAIRMTMMPSFPERIGQE
ncbi:hypothetical protein BQ8482_80093 [Mesorhizobium delmotii]|uniref:Uncharacterized protein n=1 Tax=Mesorhizobium delmotii TaxID=1631247 RepID=A0A2P9AWG9_9HYPH|nr:hypothetical protein BQ8482_80093 [Mesorhizobium delmotii]